MAKKKVKTDENTIFQLKISLAHIKPPVWRRVELRDCNLEQLHEIIQTAFGWQSYHLWVFQIGNDEFTQPPFDDEMPFVDEAGDASQVLLSGIDGSGIRKFRYIYDFGDDWEHQIVIEKILPATPKTQYPRCTKGKRACPPEDCGGPWGYLNLLETLSNPKHPDYEEQIEWLGDDFDPEQFDIDQINQHLSR